MQDLLLGRNTGIFVVKESDMENFLFCYFEAHLLKNPMLYPKVFILFIYIQSANQLQIIYWTMI